MRAVILRFYNKRLSESRTSEQNQEQPMGAGWTAYYAAAGTVCRLSSSQDTVAKAHGLTNFIGNFHLTHFINNIYDNNNSDSIQVPA